MGLLSVRAECEPRAMLLALAEYHGMGREVRELVKDVPEPKLTQAPLSKLLPMVRKLSGKNSVDVSLRCSISRAQLGALEARDPKNLRLSTLQELARGYGLPFMVVLVAALRSGGLLSAQKPVPRQRKRRMKIAAE